MLNFGLNERTYQDAGGTKEMRDKIFISYSHRDDKFRQRLEIHLKSLTSNISFWSDVRLEAGEDWEIQIHTAMNQAAIAILLVSADFLASDFIRNVELPALFEAEKKAGITIIPAILYKCNCDDLMKYQCINSPDKPLGGLRKATQEEVYARLAKVAAKKLNQRLINQYSPTQHDKFGGKKIDVNSETSLINYFVDLFDESNFGEID